MSEPERVVGELVGLAGLTAPVTTISPMVGTGFDNQTLRVELADGGVVVARVFPGARPAETKRGALLARYGVPAPSLLAATEEGSLHVHIEGPLLGDLIDEGRDHDRLWQRLGSAYRIVHTVPFPEGVVRTVGPDHISLSVRLDPVAELHRSLDGALPGLHRRAPAAAAMVDSVHDLVDACRPSLKHRPSSLLHGDVNMWNVIVSHMPWLIDWNEARVGDPAQEIGLLDEHAALFNGAGLPDGFFAGYGERSEPATSLHRLIGVLCWVGSSDWESYEQSLPSEMVDRTRAWLQSLLGYLADLDEHMLRISKLRNLNR